MIKNSIQRLVVFSFATLLFSCSATKKVVETSTGKAADKSDLLYMEIHRVALEASQNNNVPGVAICLHRKLNRSY